MLVRLTCLFAPLLLLLGASGVSGQAPRPAAGSPPDLTGIWMAQGGDIRDFSAEAPPLAPWAAEVYKTHREGVGPDESGVDELDPSIYCLPDGFPRVYLVTYPFEIVQTPGTVYMLFENTHMVRRIYLDGRKMPEDYPPSFMGYSTGRWERDTLVVETRGITSLSWLDRTGIPHSEALRVTERIRRPARDTLEIGFLFDDPEAFTRAWGAKKLFRLRTDWEIMEHIGFCEDRQRHDFSRKSLLGTKEWLLPRQ